MKKHYLLFSLAMMLFVSLQTNAQRLFPVRLSATGFDSKELTIKLGDTVQVFVVSGGTQRLTTTGVVPTPSLRIDTTIGVTSGRSGLYYVPKALGVYNFTTDNINTPEFTLTVVADEPITYDVRLSASGFDENEISAEVGDTIHFFAVANGERDLETIGIIPTPSRSIDTTLAERTGRTGLYYPLLAPGVYVFRTNVILGATDDITITVAAPVTGLDESLVYGGISFFPNPAKSEINVNLNSDYIYNVSIANLSGTTMMTRSVANSNAVRFNIDNLPNGAYLLYLSTEGTKKPKSFKFIKE